MTQDCPLLVFSDIDGTLLDHHSYQWSAAAPALAALRAIGAGLILASSKTAAEVIAFRAEIGFEDWPAIVENGAGLLPAGAGADPDTGGYQNLRAALGAVRADLRRYFTGFGDLDTDGVASVTGLPPADAARAKMRAFSEPGSWSGSDADCDAFLAHLAEAGIIAQRGGRFLTLSFGGNKADHVRALTRRYCPRMTMGLGDAPNDVAMITACDHGVVIANPHGTPLPPLPGETTGQITRTKAPGPEGWNTAVLAAIKKLER